MRRPCGGGAPFFLLRLLPASSRLRRRAMLGAPRCSRTGCAGSAIPMPQRLFVHHRRSTLHLHDCMGVPGQETWPVALSCFASSRLRRLAPSGFHRSLAPLG
ncbi:TPA: hypothetical protein L6A34_22610 [Pseudomonas aeruginosa]|nr:hypothetical protein EGJ69_00305 [Pseudomonas aeruginosa]TYT49073.1 hypothetical protein FZO85_12455 [Pseudomonas aeruginosa]HBP5774815.1 hypothetical protein [Pseudomonas aeruginosa]HBP5959895.1 hypothetical protein [Pseudomonas aeruginosa]HBP6297222.1 hypothetical protein [Pseudomonas aeruginosa]